MHSNPRVGIIHNVSDGEDKRNIALIEDLVKYHIQGNALILLTITMRGASRPAIYRRAWIPFNILSVDDLENQSAASLAKDVDPHGQRTIG